MKFRSASLVELHAFLAVCRTGSMRRAAEQLCVTQAAISRAVARLEAHLGHPLFERHAQGVLPNARAVNLRQRVEMSVDALEHAFSAQTKQRGVQPLRLSVVPTLGTRWLLPRLGAFRTQQPGIDIELLQARRDEDFRRDDVDVWIELKRPGVAWPRHIKAHYLMGREITPLCTPAIARRLKVPADLSRENLLYHTNHPANWSLWMNAAGMAGAAVKLGDGFDLAGNLIAAASSGMGVALIQPCLVERELQAEELVRPFPLAASTGRGYFVCLRKTGQEHGSARHFVDWVKAEVRHGAGTRLQS